MGFPGEKGFIGLRGDDGRVGLEGNSNPSLYFLLPKMHIQFLF